MYLHHKCYNTCFNIFLILCQCESFKIACNNAHSLFMVFIKLSCSPDSFTVDHFKIKEQSKLSCTQSAQLNQLYGSSRASQYHKWCVYYMCIVCACQWEGCGLAAAPRNLTHFGKPAASQQCKCSYLPELAGGCTSTT